MGVLLSLTAVFISDGALMLIARVPGQNVSYQNVPGQNIPGQNVLGQNVPVKISTSYHLNESLLFTVQK